MYPEFLSILMVHNHIFVQASSISEFNPGEREPDAVPFIKDGGGLQVGQAGGRRGVSLEHASPQREAFGACRLCHATRVMLGREQDACVPPRLPQMKTKPNT